jgi:glycosyltransferase involved in cell wall biosynthesis
MEVVFFGTYDERRHPRVLALREGFLAAGWDVQSVNRPLSDSTGERVAAAGNLAKTLPWLTRVVGRWRGLRSEAGQLEHTPHVVVVGYLGVFDIVLARWLFRKSTIVFDDLAPLAETVGDRGLGRLARSIAGLLDRVAVSKADIVVVDTEEHARAVRHGRADTVVVPVAAPDAWFRTPPTGREGPLRIVFFGLFTPLQGTPTIARAITLLAGAPIAFTMIGTGQDYEECRKLAIEVEDVDWIDWVDADDLPDVVASHDVCLGVFGAQAKTQVVVPNKVVQGAAAGCAVVTGDSPPVRRLFGRSAIFVPVGDHAALAQALSRLADNPALVLDLRRRAVEVANSKLRPSEAIKPLLARLSELSESG